MDRPHVHFLVHMGMTEACSLAEFIQRVSLADLRLHTVDETDAFALWEAFQSIKKSMEANGMPFP